MTLRFLSAQYNELLGSWSMTETDEMATTKTHRLKGRMSLGKGTPETEVILGGPWGYEGIGLRGGGQINRHELLSGISKLQNQRVASDTLLPRVCPDSRADQLPPSS